MELKKITALCSATLLSSSLFACGSDSSSSKKAKTTTEYSEGTADSAYEEESATERQFPTWNDEPTNNSILVKQRTFYDLFELTSSLMDKPYDEAKETAKEWVAQSGFSDAKPEEKESDLFSSYHHFNYDFIKGTVIEGEYVKSKGIYMNGFNCINMKITARESDAYPYDCNVVSITYTLRDFNYDSIYGDGANDLIEKILAYLVDYYGQNYEHSNRTSPYTFNLGSYKLSFSWDSNECLGTLSYS